MEHYIYHVNNNKETRLFVQVWEPTFKPKAFICLVHGIGEHSSRYHIWAEQFVNKGFAVISFDQKGHGLSEGKRGVITSYSDFMEDIDFILDEGSRRFKDIPCFLYGHSMGGGEVLNHLIRCKSNYIGVISTSPWIVTQAAPPKLAFPFLRLMNKLAPSFSLKTGFDSGMLSHDTNVAENYDDDDLVHHMVSFRLFVDAYDAGYFALENASRISKPLLLLHGEADEVTNCKASSNFSEKSSNLCTFIKYENAYHELHNEFCREKVFADIIEWIETRLKETN